MELAGDICVDRRGRFDDGFTLLEVLIGMVIVAILLAVAIPTLFGAKTGAKSKEVLVVAHQYDAAIREFKLTHKGRAPVFGSPGDWPTANQGPISQEGPLVTGGVPDLLLRPSRGVRLQDALVGASSAENALIKYQISAADSSAYWLIIYLQGETEPLCYLSSSIQAPADKSKLSRCTS